MNNQIKDEGLTDAYLLGKYDGIKQGRADAFDEIRSKMISFRTDAIFRYGADIIEGRADAFNDLEKWLKENNNDN